MRATAVPYVVDTYGRTRSPATVVAETPDCIPRVRGVRLGGESGYWPHPSLVKYRELLHDRPISFFDKPGD